MKARRTSLGPSRIQQARIGTPALLTGLMMTSVALGGCSGGTTEPEPTTFQRRAPSSVPFSVTLRVDDLDRLSNRCDIRVIADAKGGGARSSAEWGKLEGSSFDALTREFVGVSRTQEIFPDVFPAGEIRPGEEQQGQIDLDWFRREEGAKVLVKLEFHYFVDEGTGAHEERIARLEHECE
ncbi:MAG: hypothetical protein ACE5HP_04750 [Gemmatimonadota bacterium]